METESRQTKISEKRKRKRLPAGTGTSSIHDLNDDLLELVILGLDSPKCLIRAAATCKHWRASYRYQHRRCLCPPLRHRDLLQYQP
ncbi:unnamed protein product [Urochloa humidicola]